MPAAMAARMKYETYCAVVLPEKGKRATIAATMLLIR
jgi:hypothetical protein